MYAFVPSNIEHPITQVIAASNGRSRSPYRPSRTVIERNSSPVPIPRSINPVMNRASSLKKSVRFEDVGGSLGRTQAVIDKARTINTLNRRIVYPTYPTQTLGVGIVNASPLRSSPHRNSSPGILRPDRFSSPVRSMGIRGGLSPVQKPIDLSNKYREYKRD